jgi:signal peptidase II
MSVKLRAFFLAFSVLVVDQLTKFFALRHLSETDPLPVLGETVRFVLRFNTAAAFSLAWGGPMFLLVFNAVASVALAVYMIRMQSSRVVLFLGAILGGALGNTVDRVVQGKVTDFIDVGLGTLRWPVFNVADIAIVVGGALLLLFSGRKGSKNEQK